MADVVLPPGWSFASGGKLRYVDPSIRSRYSRGLRISTSMTREDVERIAANRGVSVAQLLTGMVERSRRLSAGTPLFDERTKQALRRLRDLRNVLR